MPSLLTGSPRESGNASAYFLLSLLLGNSLRNSESRFFLAVAVLCFTAAVLIPQEISKSRQHSRLPVSLLVLSVLAHTSVPDTRLSSPVNSITSAVCNLLATRASKDCPNCSMLLFELIKVGNIRSWRLLRIEYSVT